MAESEPILARISSRWDGACRSVWQNATSPAMDTAPQHIPDLLARHADARPDDVALLAPGRDPLTYAGLWRHVQHIAADLTARGFTRGDRIAVVLPEGPELATAVLATVSAAVCAPLNPSYQQAEFRFYLEDLQARAVILLHREGFEAPAAAAADLGIPTIVLTPDLRQPAGVFTLSAGGRAPAAATTPSPSPDDVTLVLHTSGTTSRPKRVPLTHRNLCASASNIASTLELTTTDRSLGVMPLFHIHGLVGVMLSSLSAGASVAFPGRFHAAAFFDHFRTFSPTWFSGTPAILGEILDRAGGQGTLITGSGLRFVRSASSPLSLTLAESLESCFGVPVIECYGMTEAAHQMASQQLPPAPRKPGSVGRAAGPRVGIMNDQGEMLKAGTVGEIVIQGANVTAGYEGNPVANEAAFARGWLRTGDLGRLDDDGFLFIEGRLKEVINRGGEKIAPREVEEALAGHPAVAEAGVFAATHFALGEDVAAAVVLRPGASASARELQDFLAGRLADFKVPRHVVFAEALPKSATGKLKRTSLRELFPIAVERPGAIGANRPVTPPRTPAERTLCEIWSEVLRVSPVGIDDDFFALGGDSIQVMMVIDRVRARMGVQLSVVQFFGSPTVATIGAAVDKLAGGPASVLAAPIPTGPDETAPLSFIQQLIYQLSRDPLIARTPALNRPSALRLTGTLDQEVLEASLGAVLDRHLLMRARVANRNGEPRLERCSIAPPLLQEDISSSPAELQARLVRERFVEFGDRPIDVERGPLIRFCLLRLGPAEHVLLMATHFLVFDGWSMVLFVRELAAHYSALARAEAPQVGALPIQYADFARWQAQLEAAGAFGRQADYWRSQFAVALPKVVFDMRAWTSPRNTFELKKHAFELDRDLTAGLRDLARRRHATLYMVMLSALQILFARVTGHEDVAVISESAGRSRGETEGLLGTFLNMMLLRNRVDARQPYSEFLDAVRANTLNAFDNQDVPFSLLERELFPGRSMLTEPLSPVSFNYKNFPVPTLQAGDLTIAPLDLDYQTDPFGLIFKVFERDPLLCVVLYNPLLLNRHQAAGLARCYHAILEQIVADPDVALARILPMRQFLGTMGPRALLASARQSVAQLLGI
jgi:acyl-CoA synthetase (AMP-forming)/AMP-acid ligase II/aryl carrier-like protein